MRRGEALYALATVINDMDGSDGLGGANWANQQRDVARSNGIDFRPFTDDRSRCRSEEHTSELQSLMRISYAVFCLKKKRTTTKHTQHTNNTSAQLNRNKNNQPKQ